jgi:hypothetical protein
MFFFDDSGELNTTSVRSLTSLITTSNSDISSRFLAFFKSEVGKLQTFKTNNSGK